jgi:hypothetical protein
VGPDEESDGARAVVPRTISSPASRRAPTPWVGTFGPRSFVRNAQTVEIGLDTDQAYFFDLDDGLAIRT